MKPRTTARLALMLSIAIIAGEAVASDPVRHSGQASAHSAMAVGEFALAGAKLATGAVAVPLMISGGVGALSGEAGSSLWHAAGGTIGDPLPVADETYVTTPSPRDAMAE